MVHIKNCEQNELRRHCILIRIPQGDDDVGMTQTTSSGVQAVAQTSSSGVQAEAQTRSSGTQSSTTRMEEPETQTINSLKK